MRRRGAKVRAWVGFTTLLSGAPDQRHLDLVELDCVRRRSRVLEGLSDVGHGGPGATRRRKPAPERWSPIVPGSVAEALARTVCKLSPTARSG